MFNLIYVITIIMFYVNSFRNFFEMPLVIYDASLIGYCCIGIMMFPVRLSETNLSNYWANCCKKNKITQERKDGTDSLFNYNSDNEEKEERMNDNFFAESLPLGEIIQKTMNLEFMCCILYGLTKIFKKQQKKISNANQNEDKINKVPSFIEVTTPFVNSDNEEIDVNGIKK